MIPSTLHQLTARIVLVAYFLATTAAAGWHDHRGCTGTDCDGCVACPAETGHTHAHGHVHKHAPHHSHKHNHCHTRAGEHHHHQDETETDEDGLKLRGVSEHHCLVCQFLALSPLITAAPELSGQLTLIPLMLRPIPPKVEAQACSEHPARGPPAA